ncbi:MAG: hypothetical protein Q8L48_20505 [Archangium sp.]|nr:hypothetical protein [Archangium sp.]
MRQLFLVVVVVSACTKAPVETPPPPKPKPAPASQDLQQLLTRELADSVGEEFIKLGTRQLKVEAAGPVQAKPDAARKFVEFNLPLGTQMPVQCFVYEAPIDAGATISRAIASVKDRLTVASLRLWAVEVVEGSPAAFVEVGYLVDSPEGKKGGQLKLAVFPDVPNPVFCLHDEPGYLKSFQRVATRLASVVARSTPQSGPVTTYRTVSVDTVQGRPVGFETVRFTKTDDGVRHISTLATLFLPRSPTEWMAQDQATISDLDADGFISARRVVAVTNGELQFNMLVTHNGGRLYTYAGTSSGKELAGTFKTKGARGFEGDVMFSHALRDELLTGKVKQLDVEQYIPDLTPIAPTVFVTRRSATGPRAVEMETAQLKIIATLDANGDSEATDVQLGPVSLHSERKFLQGAPE